MAKIKHYEVGLSEEQLAELVENGSITVGGVTINIEDIQFVDTPDSDYTNEQIDEKLNTKQNSTDNNLTTTNKQIVPAINEVNSLAKGAQKAVSYGNYLTMVTAFNSFASDVYSVGQNVMIVTLEVPDLWVSEIETTSVPYTYTTDEAITTALQTDGYIQVGYYKLSALETRKIDLSDYVNKTSAETIPGVKTFSNGLETTDIEISGDITDGTNTITVENIADKTNLSAELIDIGSLQTTIDSQVFPKMTVAKAREIYTKYSSGKLIRVSWSAMGVLPIEFDVLSTSDSNYKITAIIHDKLVKFEWLSTALDTDEISPTIQTSIGYTTTAPTEANTDGLKLAVLSSEPTTRYNGWIYMITE